MLVQFAHCDVSSVRLLRLLILCNRVEGIVLPQPSFVLFWWFSDFPVVKASSALFMTADYILTVDELLVM